MNQFKQIFFCSLFLTSIAFTSSCGTYPMGSGGAAYISPAKKNIPIVETPGPEIPTEKEDVMVFATAERFSGDLLKNVITATTPREAADALCEMNRTVEMEDRSIRALISIHATDQISGMTAFGMPSNKPFVGDLGVTVADDLADLLDSSIAVPLVSALKGVSVDEEFWLGSMADGTVDVDTCSEWKSDLAIGSVGSSTPTDGTWLKFGSRDCAELRKLICVAF